MIEVIDMTGTPRPPRKPETRSAWLVSEGFENPTVTKHVYIRTIQSVELPCDEAIADVFIYRCLETGAERVWGAE